MFPDLSTVNTIAFDTETSGLHPHNDYPVGYVVTWGFRPEESKYYPIRHEGGGNLESDEVISFVRKTLARSDLRVVMHNAAFDLWMSEKDGIRVNGPIEDTGINAALINENMGTKAGLLAAGYSGKQFLTGYSLASCCSRADVQAKRGEPMYEHLAARFGGDAAKGQMSNYWRLPGDDEMAVEYAEGDGTSTLQLWAWQQSRLDRDDLRRVWKVECDLIPVLHRARVRGVPIDEDELGRVHEHVKKLRAECIEAIGGINPRAPSQVGPYIESIATSGFSDTLSPDLSKEERRSLVMEKWDTDIVPLPPMTKPTDRFPEGQPSYSTKYLKRFSGGAPIIKVREYAHLEDFSIVPLIERHIHNGKIYPNFWQLATDDYGTVTGRLSASDPSPQQVTKRKKHLGKLYRRVFIPPEGMRFWEQDYSQCEYRLFAHYSQAESLIKGYNEDGIDMHDLVARLLGLPRDQAKNMNFGILYGMGDRSLAEHLGIPVSEAKNLKRQYFSEVPEAEHFMKRAAYAAEKRGYVRTLLGRRRRYTDPRKLSYQAINSICQGGNADIIKMKMVEVDDYLRSSGRGDFVFSIHDALVSYLDPANDHETAKEIERICTDFRKDVHGFDLRVGMKLDSGFGRNWAEASYADLKEAA